MYSTVSSYAPVKRCQQRRAFAGFSFVPLFHVCFFLILLMTGASASATNMYADTLITGRVTGEDNEPLPGANVTLRSAPAKGVTTRPDGSYSIMASPRDVLVVTFVGYARQEIGINGRQRVDIILQAQATSLEKVVVVGYGTQKRGEVTGAISSVDAGDIKDLPAASLQQSLQGKSAGVQITQNSGSPGKNAQSVSEG
ncbi:carboxypeptidase-like regulatory domain-containing protein [Chitinophaga pinensis]|uniref:SusC/RagA family TonB-linked outer membrane protein n=1 Tax=Chitinophaga pinensis TaxID=79329 RepID=A0A5C6LLS0_9BACT|nr:carboxypeptidase-like regulatory domain-containing protein [Chitinophaga pinensis]TWV95078.1 hypothetical protein FEF09_25105 [Chitinophaga pinensis]